ncbi:MAG: DEAD/DEAH box helicase [Planctomycetota bacterium]
MTTFRDLDLIEPLQRAIAHVGYTSPTPIQAQAIPPLLDGRDVLGCAQTGTGKTAAFALPVLQHLAAGKHRRGPRPIRALVLTPTRELASQIDACFSDYGANLPLKTKVIFGGVKEGAQIDALRRGVDVLVATPGRLLDLEGRGHVDLRHVEFFVLDEADRMLDMGFIHDVKKVLARLPRERQNLLFSATMPAKVVDLAQSFLTDPVQIEVTPQSSTVEKIEQRVYFTDKGDKRHLLVDLVESLGVDRAIVFTRTKHGANRLTKQLVKAGIESAPIHGNKSQGARERALEGFREGKVRLLVATDLASRGLDIDEVTHVFNFDLPNEPEVYVHRIGRTGRAGRDGIAIAFCDTSEGEMPRDIEKLTGQDIPVVTEHAYHCEAAMPAQARGSRRGMSASSARAAVARAAANAPAASAPAAVAAAAVLRGGAAARLRTARAVPGGAGAAPARCARRSRPGPGVSAAAPRPRASAALAAAVVAADDRGPRAGGPPPNDLRGPRVRRAATEAPPPTHPGPRPSDLPAVGQPRRLLHRRRPDRDSAASRTSLAPRPQSASPDALRRRTLPRPQSASPDALRCRTRAQRTSALCAPPPGGRAELVLVAFDPQRDEPSSSLLGVDPRPGRSARRSCRWTPVSDGRTWTCVGAERVAGVPPSLRAA